MSPQSPRLLPFLQVPPSPRVLSSELCARRLPGSLVVAGTGPVRVISVRALSPLSARVVVFVVVDDCRERNDESSIQRRGK